MDQKVFIITTESPLHPRSSHFPLFGRDYTGKQNATEIWLEQNCTQEKGVLSFALRLERLKQLYHETCRQYAQVREALLATGTLLLYILVDDHMLGVGDELPIDTIQLAWTAVREQLKSEKEALS